MGTWIELRAQDGQAIGAYRADPTGQLRGRVVVLQELFGVNGHIREVCDGYAADGFMAVAPALFDRAQANVDLPYDQFAQARALREQFTPEQTMLDVRAAVDALAPGGKVAVIGFCWGGTLAWLGAAELPIAGAVGYYGSQIGQHLERRPRCPVQLHFGGNDQSTPPAMIEGLRKAHAAVEVYVYAGAGHAFNRRGFPPYNEGAAATARIRTLAFLETVMR